MILLKKSKIPIGCFSICLFLCIAAGTLPAVVTGTVAGLAPDGKFVGNITQSGNIPAGFETYWNQMTCENEGKWASVESRRDSMNWSGIDRAYNFAKQHGMPYKQHTFVWGSQYPSWMDNLSPKEQKEEVEEWIRLYCERYPDTEMIDVVNEPDHATPSWYNAIGGAGSSGHDWVIWSFEKARQYCPDATLILNDYNVLRWHTSNFVSIAKKLKARGLLDAVGAQAHSLEDQSFTELQGNFNQVAALGVPIYISEYDINIADDNEQMRVMQQQFPFFYENRQVAGITFWGYLYGQTWRQNTGLIRNGKPRPAMNWLCNYFTDQDCGGQSTDPVPDPIPGKDHTIVVRARGITGEEHINLRIAGTTIASWQLSVEMRNYTATANGIGAIEVEFDNDSGDRDVVVDYIMVDGEIRQAEDQSYNTGAYADGRCGGGSYTEWLHCSGVIGFGDLPDNAGDPIPDSDTDTESGSNPPSVNPGCGGGGGGCGDS